MLHASGASRRAPSMERLHPAPQQTQPQVLKYIQDELFWASNAFLFCLKVPHHLSKRVRKARSRVAAAAPKEADRPFEKDLDFKATLSRFVVALCWFIPPLLIFGIPMMMASSQDSLADAIAAIKQAQGTGGRPWLRWARHAVWKALTSTAVSLVMCYQLCQVQYARLMRKPEELADADSLFLKCCGVTAHYKCVGPEFHEPTACAIACYHGFGANLWSWELVQRRLAESIGGLVSAHDMPGFGLTERSKDQKVFSLMTNGNIGRQILSHELANLGGHGHDGRGAESSTTDAKQRVPKILVGHSLGCVAMVTSFIENPEDVDGLVLVAPAIMASPFKRRAQLLRREVRVSGSGQISCLEELYGVQSPSQGSSNLSEHAEAADVRAAGTSPLRAVEAGATAVTEGNVAPGSPPAWQAGDFSQWRNRERRRVLGRFVRRQAARLWTLWTRVVFPVLLTVFQPAAVAVLRFLLRKKSFWERGLKFACFDSATLTPDLLYRYRLPALVQGWEAGLWRFLRARIAGDIETKGRHSGEATTLLDEFKTALESKEASGQKVPVMILHGEQDWVMPIWNSCRLSAVLGVPLVKVPNCGHTPAEEVPDCFVHEMAQFVKLVQSTR